MYDLCGIFVGMKYRMLSTDELQHLEPELKQFLIVNGIDGDTWRKLNQEEPDKAVKLVEVFSDSVLQRVYERVRFLEHRSNQSCMVFRMEADHIQLIAIQAEEGDLSTADGIHLALRDNPEKLNIFKSRKDYNRSRELEIHTLLEQGCIHSSESFWDFLQQLIQK